MTTKSIEKLTCITSDKETYNGQPLYKTLLKLAEKSNILQATATRGLDMVSPGSPSSHGNAFQDTTHPIVVQVLGSPEENQIFLEKAAPIMQNHIIFKEQIQMASAT